MTKANKYTILKYALGLGAFALTALVPQHAVMLVGIGAAVGVALGDRARGVKRTVVATIGDGSCQYSVQAIWTAAQHDLPIVFVVMRNEEYSILKAFALLEKAPGVPGMDLPGLDIVSIATGFGCRAVHADTTEQLTEQQKAQARTNAVLEAGVRIAGAIVLGKSVTTEFAGAHAGKTHNPHNIRHTPAGGTVSRSRYHLVPGPSTVACPATPPPRSSPRASWPGRSTTWPCCANWLRSGAGWLPARWTPAKALSRSNRSPTSVCFSSSDRESHRSVSSSCGNGRPSGPERAARRRRTPASSARSTRPRPSSSTGRPMAWLR